MSGIGSRQLDQLSKLPTERNAFEPEGIVSSIWQQIDTLRQVQGRVLDAFGLGPIECPYRVVASGSHWRLRYYRGGEGPPLLIVAAPIKQPYIWDLAPAVSVVRHCLRRSLQVFLLEWAPPSPGNSGAGLADYAGRSISEAVASLTRETSGTKPFVMGHSLGGTLAATFAAVAPRTITGLVLLAAPLCFAAGSSRFRDAIVSLAPPSLNAGNIMPGSWLSQLCVLACPETFLWSRIADAGLSLSDPQALAVHARVERWALDEFPLPGRLVHEILEWLYHEDRLCNGTLPISTTTVGPARLQLPTLLVVNRDDELAPPASVRPFIEAMPPTSPCLIEHSSEIGVGLAHLAILIGRRAHAHVWPQIFAWLHSHA